MPRKSTREEIPPELLGEEEVRFISSGSYLLDRVLGGGWAQGRVVNIVGDKSTGKTLLFIEAAANFDRAGAERIRYGEAESAFSKQYAFEQGLPRRTEYAGENEPLETVEDFYTDLDNYLEDLSGAAPSLYCLDSLDALSSADELERDFDKDSYGVEKQKNISKLFRMKIRAASAKQCTLMIISQVRDNIGVTIGKKTKRSGGRALDFYASQVLWLSEITKLVRTERKVERVVGIRIRAKCEKNKVGLPFRDAELVISFGYGVDDERSMYEWLKEHDAAGDLVEKKAKGEKGRGRDKFLDDLADARYERDIAALADMNKKLRMMVDELWLDVEERLKPPMRKYE